MSIKKKEDKGEQSKSKMRGSDARYMIRGSIVNRRTVLYVKKNSIMNSKYVFYIVINLHSLQ